MFIRSGSSQRAFWKSYACERRVLSSRRHRTNRLAYNLPTSFARRVVRKTFTISSMLMIRSENPRESKSSIFLIIESSSIKLKLCRGLYFSGWGVRPLIRAAKVDFGTSYVYAARRIDILWVVRIASIARMILVSWVQIGMVFIMVQQSLSLEVAMRSKSVPRDDVSRAMINHIIYSLKIKRFYNIKIYNIKIQIKSE